MTKLELINLFKGLGVALVVLIPAFLTTFLSKEKTKISRLISRLSGVAMLSIFIAMVVIIITNAKTEEVRKAADIDGLHKSDIYNIVFYTLTYFARTTIFLLIAGAFVYLLNRSRKHPSTPVFLIHKALLLIGIVGVAILYIQDILKSIADVEYAKVISFGQYVSIFVGGIFWMFLCSIIAAAALPETKER